MQKIKRGDIFLADLTPVMGTDVEDIRPVMIIQNDIANKFSPTVVVAAITSQIRKGKLPTHIDLDAQSFNLRTDSVVLLEQIRTIDKMRLLEKISSVSDSSHTIKQINEAYLISGGIVPFDNIREQTEKEYYKYKINTEVRALENTEYEFKEVKGLNPRNSIKDQAGPNATAFLNNKGGKILFGVDNNGIIKGFKADRKVIDDIKLVIHDTFRTISPSIAVDFYDIYFHNVYDNTSGIIEDMYVLEIVIPPRRNKKDIYFYKSRELHVRVDGATHFLKADRIVAFIANRLSMHS